MVPAPTVGAEPLDAVKVGVAGAIALNNRYCFTVAPDEGKAALVQERSICELETAEPDITLACVVGGLDKVLKLLSVLKLVYVELLETLLA